MRRRRACSWSRPYRMFLAPRASGSSRRAMMKPCTPSNFSATDTFQRRRTTRPSASMTWPHWVAMLRARTGSARAPVETWTTRRREQSSVSSKVTRVGHRVGAAVSGLLGMHAPGETRRSLHHPNPIPRAIRQRRRPGFHSGGQRVSRQHYRDGALHASAVQTATPGSPTATLDVGEQLSETIA